MSSSPSADQSPKVFGLVAGGGSLLGLVGAPTPSPRVKLSGDSRLDSGECTRGVDTW